MKYDMRPTLKLLVPMLKKYDGIDLTSTHQIDNGSAVVFFRAVDRIVKVSYPYVAIEFGKIDHNENFDNVDRSKDVMKQYIKFNTASNLKLPETKIKKIANDNGIEDKLIFEHGHGVYFDAFLAKKAWPQIIVEILQLAISHWQSGAVNKKSKEDKSLSSSFWKNMSNAVEMDSQTDIHDDDVEINSTIQYLKTILKDPGLIVKSRSITDDTSISLKSSTNNLIFTIDSEDIKLYDKTKMVSARKFRIDEGIIILNPGNWETINVDALPGNTLDILIDNDVDPNDKRFSLFSKNGAWRTRLYINKEFHSWIKLKKINPSMKLTINTTDIKNLKGLLALSLLENRKYRLDIEINNNTDYNVSRQVSDIIFHKSKDIYEKAMELIEIDYDFMCEIK